MSTEIEEIIIKKQEQEPADEKDASPLTKRAADLVKEFKEESDVSESEVEIIHINTINGDEESDSSPPKKRREIQDDSGNTPKKKRYLQKYVKDWEKVPAFRQWVTESLLGNTYFYCKFCKTDNKCGKTELEKHMLSRKHIRNSKGATMRVQVNLCTNVLFMLFKTVCFVEEILVSGVVVSCFHTIYKKWVNTHYFTITIFFFIFLSFSDINYELIAQYVLYLQRCGVTGIISKKITQIFKLK